MAKRLATVNVRDNPDLPRKAVRECGRVAARISGLAGFQEINEKQDHLDLIQSMPGFDHVGASTSTPIYFKSKVYEIVSIDDLPDELRDLGVSGWERAHGGRSRTSPVRGWTYVFLRRRNRSGRAKKRKIFAVINTHFVSGAWNAKRRLSKAWRKAQWMLHWGKLSLFVRRIVRAGVSVIFMGDFNRLRVRKLKRTQKWLAQHGIDKIGCVEARDGVEFESHGWSHFDNPSDHDAVQSRVTLLDAA